MIQFSAAASESAVAPAFFLLPLPLAGDTLGLSALDVPLLLDKAEGFASLVTGRSMETSRLVLSPVPDKT